MHDKRNRLSYLDCFENPFVSVFRISSRLLDGLHSATG